MKMSRAFRVMLVVGLTILLAPIIYAAVEGMRAGRSAEDRISQARALLEGYRIHSPSPVSLPYIDWDAGLRDCGYRREQLFAEHDRGSTGAGTAWTPHGGYRSLFIQRLRETDELAEAGRADLLRAQTSAFSSEFLRTCLRQSLFAPICAQRVAAMLTRDHPAMPAARHVADRRRDRTICTYLDGLAARNGQPMAMRDGR